MRTLNKRPADIHEAEARRQRSRITGPEQAQHVSAMHYSFTEAGYSGYPSQYGHNITERPILPYSGFDEATSPSGHTPGGFDTLSLVIDTPGSLTSPQLAYSGHVSPRVLTPTNSEASEPFYAPLQTQFDHYSQPLDNDASVQENNPRSFGHNALEQDIHMEDLSELDYKQPYIYHTYPIEPSHGFGPAMQYRTLQTADLRSNFQNENPTTFEQHGADLKALLKRQRVQGSTQPHDKSARRNGPLSTEGRKNANDVRKIGACVRCKLMQEKCTGFYDKPCNNCSAKKFRKWPLGCIREHLDARLSYLFPDVVKNRLDQQNVIKWIEASFWHYTENTFRVNLSNRLGININVLVREIEPLDNHTCLDAFIPNKDGTRMQINQHWSPPLWLPMTDIRSEANDIRKQIRNCFKTIIDDRNSNWAWDYFPFPHEDWQAEMLEIIHRYYRADIPEHDPLYHALSALFFNHILIRMFEVPEEEVPNLIHQLQNKPRFQLPPQGSASPILIGRYIKMLILPLAMEVTSKALKGLHDLLTATSQDHTEARRDLAFAVAFVLLIIVGRTQISVLQTAYASKPVGSDDISVEGADEYVQEIEQKLANYIIPFCEYAFQKRKRQGKAGRKLHDWDQHAANFGLIDRLRKATNYEYLDKRPRSFELPPRDIETFETINVRRLCWKLYRVAVEQVS